MRTKMALVTGAGGFIGGHLVNSLVSDGYDVLAVDIKPESEWYQVNSDAENVFDNDLRRWENVKNLVFEGDEVYNLAANMGGIGYIHSNKADCMMSVSINTNMLEAAKEQGADRYFYASSACVYPDYRQGQPDILALKENDAYPAMPEDGYGWEKLFSERMCRHFYEDFGLETRIGRYHNVYGPFGTWDGGREKAPAAIARKVAQAVLNGNHEIDIWGDGEQTRSFMYIDDCVKGTRMLMGSNFREPLNLGSSEMVSINQLVDVTEKIAGISLKRNYDMSKPQGVRGRNSDNTLIKEVFDWEPSISLIEGMEKTYRWVYDQVYRSGSY